MIFKNEKEFEAHIRHLITKHVLPLNKDLVLIRNKKAVDVLICRNGKKPALYFIEIKYHRINHGRLGTGHGKGGGIQPEILQLQPDYFKKQMRWILGSEDKEGYWILSNWEIMQYVAKGAIGEKYNNIQMKLFREKKPFTERQFIKELKGWLI
jgi:hypothetical protein